MRVLGIDPGYDRIGIAVVEGNNGNQDVIFSECFTTNTKDSFSKRLLESVERVVEMCEKHKPDTVALENLFFSKNQKTAMRVAEVRGALLYALEKNNFESVEYTPQAIKVAVSGYGRGTKKDIANMLHKLVDLPDRKMLDDEYDAIAVAITHIVSNKAK